MTIPMFSYEGNTPHTVKHVGTEFGSLFCEYCGACLVDHVLTNEKDAADVEITSIQVGYRNERMTFPIYIRFDYGDNQWKFDRQALDAIASYVATFR